MQNQHARTNQNQRNAASARRFHVTSYDAEEAEVCSSRKDIQATKVVPLSLLLNDHIIVLFNNVDRIEWVCSIWI